MGTVLFLQILRLELRSLRWFYRTIILLHQMITQKLFATKNLNSAKLFISIDRKSYWIKKPLEHLSLKIPKIKKTNVSVSTLMH